LTVGALLVGGCPPQGETPPPINVAAGFQAVYVVADAASPAALAPAPEGDSRVFYAEKNTGQIRVIKDGTLLDEPFATMPVNFAGDRGLLSIALHPRFTLNGRIYAFYSRSDTGEPTNDPQAIVHHRLVYFEAAEKGGDVSTGTEVFLASFPTAGSLTRIGGRIGFAPDGKLLVALGDMGDPESAQIPDLPLGKILRFNDDGSIPTNNPAADSATYASGFSDPRGLAFDPVTGDPFVTELNLGGPNQINLVQAGSNYGWPTVVGFADTPEELAFVAAHPDFGATLTESHTALLGAAFNPSGQYGPNQRLRLFYGASDENRILSLELSLTRTAAVTAHSFLTGLPTPINDLAFTPGGTLYVACADAILRIAPTATP
jgi:glucose/arabinose dehydrogenase